MSIFAGEREHLEYLSVLRNYCKNEVTPLMLCACAYREKWDRMVNITTTIETMYRRWFGEFSYERAACVVERIRRSERLSWSYSLLKNDVQQGHKKTNTIKFKYLCVLFVTNEL